MLVAKPPNIVYIISDDQSWNDYGFINSDIQTPHLDKLAKESVLLSEDFTALCRPSLMTMLTGHYASVTRGYR